MLQAHLKITGTVQGVFYRSSAEEEAKTLGLKGYVKNMPDDSVEAVIQGGKGQIESFIAWTKKGPPSAKVDNVEVLWQEAEKEFSDFIIS